MSDRYGRHDEAQELANHMGRDLHVGSDGVLRVDPKEAVSSERHGHSDQSQGTSGGCGQHEDNLGR
jgi:hypothetical protein